jgi:hypothetical protein
MHVWLWFAALAPVLFFQALKSVVLWESYSSAIVGHTRFFASAVQTGARGGGNETRLKIAREESSWPP